MEGDAGTGRLNPTVPREREVPPADDSTAETDELVSEAPPDSADVLRRCRSASFRNQRSRGGTFDVRSEWKGNCNEQ